MKATRVVLLLAAVLALSGAAPADDIAGDGKKSAPRPIVGITDDDGDSSWFNWPGFSQLFGPLWQLFPNFEDIGPKITGDDEKFQVVIRVKDFNKDDLKIKVNNGFLIVQGSHESSGQSFDILANQFVHTYLLSQNSSAADVTADLYSNGYLVVTAPLKGPADRANEKERVVPINVIDKPYSTTSEAPAVAESNEDRREQTTPPADDKENKIEHGP
ncbi:Protein lethal(2)essential for life [Eumeta japonica]|uniref:Protein lethal(2)essential for life n=1 Tax=Eumeta variegata TaxID=151549 RepID=A0A4C1U3G1_EUMVA|nr:Protein lethal(2)essential for life [Eumeta japonica]